MGFRNNSDELRLFIRLSRYFKEALKGDRTLMEMGEVMFSVLQQ